MVAEVYFPFCDFELNCTVHAEKEKDAPLLAVRETLLADMQKLEMLGSTMR